MSLPLEGVRIVTVEQFGAGPYGSMYLADLGAEVIKIENPQAGGDVSRSVAPHLIGDGDSEFFQTFNLNKKSLGLNLKSEAGREVLHRLVGEADAVMNNLRGDQPDKLGLTYGALAPHNPRIVCAHLSAYGRDNERAGWPGYDYLMQSEAGFLSLTGEPGTPPARFGLSIIDFMTGIVTAVGLLAAIIGARESGRGRDVDVSLFDVALHQLSYPATWYLNEGEITTRLPRGSHPSATPAQLVKTADGWIFVMCMLEKFWITMLKELDRLDLAADADFVDMESRRRHRDRLTGVLDEIFGTAPTEHWLGRLQGRIPVAPVYDVPQALDNEFVERIGMLQRLAHPQKGELRVLRNPIRIDGHRLGGRVCPPLGSDTDSVLRRLGFDDEDISRLEAAGAVGRGDAA